MAKPRMTRRDAWSNPRPIVAKYRAWCMECQVRNLRVPSLMPILVFYIEMPKSWPKYKKEDMFGRPHQATPDVDNMVKAVLDVSLANDKEVWSVWAAKLWSWVPGIAIGDQQCRTDREETLDLLALPSSESGMHCL